jgi:hypothetical protein
MTISHPGRIEAYTHPDWFTTTDDFVVETTSVTASSIRRYQGRVLWDAWPDSEEVFKPIYEAARRDGHADAITMYGGDVSHTDVTKLAHGYLVQYAVIDVIDTTTTAALAASLARYEALLSGRSPGQECVPPGPEGRVLRLVPPV